MSFQYFAKEKYPKKIDKYIAYDSVIELGQNIWTAFSGKWKTIEQAYCWYEKNAMFFINRGIELMLFYREEEGGFMPVKHNHKIAI